MAKVLLGVGIASVAFIGTGIAVSWRALKWRA